eukprot:COSAG04_NODE_832_length_10009_cov_5.848940_8_plen_63_part_00
MQVIIPAGMNLPTAPEKMPQRRAITAASANEYRFFSVRDAANDTTRPEPMPAASEAMERALA